LLVVEGGRKRRNPCKDTIIIIHETEGIAAKGKKRAIFGRLNRGKERARSKNQRGEAIVGSFAPLPKKESRKVRLGLQFKRTVTTRRRGKPGRGGGKE